MSWIKARENLPDDPTVHAISRRFGWPRTDAAVGPLLKVWAWAGGLTSDGFLPHATLDDVDGQASQLGFGQALLDVYWLFIVDGGLRFPKWDRHNSDQAKARSLASERQKRWRDVDGQASTDVDGRASPEERRGDKKKKNPHTPKGVVGSVEPPKKTKPRKELWTGELPAALRVNGFPGAWQDFLAFRVKDLRAPVTQRSGDALLAKLARWGPDVAERALQASIENDWRGVFPPDRTPSPKSKEPPSAAWKRTQPSSNSTPPVTSAANACSSERCSGAAKIDSRRSSSSSLHETSEDSTPVPLFEASRRSTGPI